MNSIISDELTLCDNVFKSGIVFLLSKNINIPFNKFYTKRIGIWHITIKKGSKLVVAKTKRKLKKDSIFASAYKSTQEFLDIISIEIRHYNSIKHHQNYTLWYLEKNKRILEIIFRDPIIIKSDTQIRVTSIDKRKKEKILSNSISQYHPGLRYFRLSRNNNDFIDAFRNQYLAFEEFLSSLMPKNNREREWNWIDRGLNNLTQLNKIAKILNCTDLEVGNNFKNKIYNVRLSLFHAKDGQTHFLPGDIIIKKNIINSLQLLENINYILLDIYYDKTIPRGGMLFSGLKSIASSICNKEKNFKILISSKIDKVKSDSRLDEEMIVPYLICAAKSTAIDATVNTVTDIAINSILAKFTKLSRVGLISDNKLYGINQLEKPIELSEIIDIIRINDHIDIISEDLHQFFY